ISTASRCCSICSQRSGGLPHGRTGIRLQAARGIIMAGSTGSTTLGKAKAPPQGQDSLEKIELLAGLSPAARLDVERACQWRRFAAGEQILDRNSDSRDVYFVVDGSVEVVNFSGNGRE